MITLSKDPFKAVPIQDHCKQRVVCAYLTQELGEDGYDHEEWAEANSLKKEAVDSCFKRKDAYAKHCKRTFRQFKNSDYGVVDCSSLQHNSTGVRQYYKEALTRSKEFYHVVEVSRTKF